VIALGSDDEVRGTSRGDSHVIDLRGASVVALGQGPDARWPPDATLEVGGRADLAVLANDPRRIDGPARQPLWPSLLSAADTSSPEGCQGRPAPRHELDRRPDPDSRPRSRSRLVSRLGAWQQQAATIY